MHISDGVLSPGVLAAGTALAAGGIAMGLKKISFEDMPRLAVFTSVFFVVSIIHVPLGPSGAHLVLNGLAGIALGWGVFPALFLGLLLQSVIFSHGGITALGVNTFNMALPGLLCWKIFSLIRSKAVAGFISGFIGITGSLLLLSASLVLSERAFIPAAALLSTAHLPLALAEGLITASAVGFLIKTAPEIIGFSRAS